MISKHMKCRLHRILVAHKLIRKIKALVSDEYTSISRMAPSVLNASSTCIGIKVSAFLCECSAILGLKTYALLECVEVPQTTTTLLLLLHIREVELCPSTALVETLCQCETAGSSMFDIS